MKVWVFLLASLVLAFGLLVLEIGVLALFVNTSHFNGTLYDIAFYPLWALNAFPAGQVLHLFGLRVYRRASERASVEGSQQPSTGSVIPASGTHSGAPPGLRAPRGGCAKFVSFSSESCGQTVNRH